MPPEDGTQRAGVRVPVYLDHHATTPTDPRVLEAMAPWFAERFGNPHSTDHAFGREAAEAVETARGHIAALIGAEPREIVFTSGATESNNLAIKGAARFERRRRNRRRRLATLASEHKCVVESVRAMADEGFEAEILPVSGDGLVDLDALARAVDDATLLVSVMAANNEIGVLQPIEAVGALARARGALFHTDAAQAAGKTPLDVGAAGIDLLSLSGHKMYGPKGVGALYVRRRPRARIEPLFSGGGQERTLRPGTVPAPLAIGLGEACRIAREEMATEGDRVSAPRDRFLKRLAERVGGVEVNGCPRRRLPGNLAVRLDGVDALELIDLAPDLAFSTGSACASAAVEPSHVLRAIGLSDEEAGSSARFGLGRFTTAAEVDFAVDRLAEAVRACRRAASAA